MTTCTLADVRTGDVLLLRQSTTAFGRLIRLWTASPYSHAAVAVWIRDVTGAERLCALESLEPGGVRLYPLDRYVRESTLDLYALAGGHETGQCAAFALRKLGEPYALPRQFVESFGLVRRLWRKLTGGHAPLVDRRGEFCSELAADWLAEMGCELPGRPWELSPADLVRVECLTYRGTLVPEEEGAAAA